ncbi:TonB-dependent siderophore receptor [Marivibrio halodurans]|uniref:TonB-dependent siderophore receptor n=1 Tax=Marivibrio halodurans TaxID=2039722 RepID=A0A8J7V1P0_9PROT|nr:TonB-dependent siderophore receptor [Marivibrio halodurans]MBP5856545.1 TonB-dependent siderophore receptor [Marivibrio halodurans]
MADKVDRRMEAGRARGALALAAALAGTVATGLASTTWAETPGSRSGTFVQGVGVPAPISFEPGAQLAQAEGENVTFDIPAQPLTSALAAFGRQSGLQVTVDGAIARGHDAPDVHGSMTAEEALRRLIAGSGLTYQRDGGTIALRRRVGENGTMQLDPITVEGQGHALDPGRTEDTGSYAGSQVSVGSKMPMSIREIPQSVSVVTRQRMEDEDLVSLQDAMERTTGVRVQYWDDDRASFSARGHDASLLRDGVPVTHMTNFTAAPDLVAYDRIEVLRGPAGLFHGAGEAGGSINLVRKRALEDARIKGSAQAGSWNNYRGEVDVTGALVESGRLRGRLAGSYQDKESFIDIYDQQESVIYGTVEGDLTPATTLSVGGIYFEQDKHQFQGIPIAYTTGEMVELPRHSNLGHDWSRGNESASDLFVEVEHGFDNGVDLTLSGRHVERDRDGFVSYVTSGIDRATGTVSSQAWEFIAGSEDTSFDANIAAPTRFFGQQQEFLVGADYTLADHRSQWGSSAAFRTDAFAPDHHFPLSTIRGFSSDWEEDTEQIGAYGQANIKPGLDWLTLVAGGRFTWWDYVNTNNAAGTTTSDVTVSGEFTPKLGVVADVTEELSTYASYAAIFEPQTNLDPSGEVIDPREGEQFEVGVKGEFMDGRLLAHLAAYQIEDKNRATQIDGCVGPLCAEAAGLVRSRGVEMEVSGSPAPGWQAMAGYAYTYATYVDDPTNQGEVFASYIPKHMVNLSATYSFEGGALDGLSLGGGGRFMSSYFDVSGGNRYTQDAYALFDARVGYDLTKEVSAQFAVKNLLDEEYFERLGGVSRNNYWGTPRSYMLTLRGEW